MADTFVQRMRRFFGFKTEVTQSGGFERETIEPVDKGTGKKAPFSEKSRRIWDWYLKSTSDSAETLKNKLERYKDIDYMIYNETLASFTVDLYADETAQADDQFNLISVTAKKATVENRIKQLFDQWGIDQEYIRDVAYNLVAYGDSFDVIETDDKKGIMSLTPINVYDVTERLEFKLSEIKKLHDKAKRFSTQQTSSIEKYIKSIETDKGAEDFSRSYLSYLFGFVLNGDEFVYPWQVNHYRLNSQRSEFFPYGKSLLINLIGPYRQLKTSMNLMALTRAMKFPKEIYEVETSDEMTSVEKWQAVNEARTEFQNLGVLNKSKEEFSLGDEIWMPEGLVKFQTKTNDLRIEDIADIELLRENFIMGTKVPKGYLIVDGNSSWGTSGQSLLQQSKPFGRAVYTVQSAILKNLSHLVRMHFLMTGEFEKEFTEFQIALNFPIVEEASDRARMKQDSLRLANDIIDNLKTALGQRDVELPPKVVKDLFSKFSFLDADMINELVDAMAPVEGGESPVDPEAEGKKFHETAKRFDEDIVNLAYFDALNKLDVKECVRNKKHHISSNGKFIQNEYRPIYGLYRFLEKEKKLEE